MLATLAAESELQLLMQGNALARVVKGLPVHAAIQDAEFRCFSQFGEDGIIQFLTHHLAVEPRTFVEFGVQDYRESNTRFLLYNDYWSGLVMDGSARNVRAIEQDRNFWRCDLKAAHAWITRENINPLLVEAGFQGPLGLLSIDIDGNDYWVWEAIEAVDPVIVVCEYNNLLGGQRALVVPYSASFDRNSLDPTQTYWGASLQALCRMGERKGYAFVGSNQAGVNAFFVKKERLGGLRSADPGLEFRPCSFREGMTGGSHARCLSRRERLQRIAHLDLLDLESGQTVKLGDCGLE